MQFRMMIEHVSEVINFIWKKETPFVLFQPAVCIDWNTVHKIIIINMLKDKKVPQKRGMEAVIYKMTDPPPQSPKQKYFTPKTCMITLRLNT